MQVAVVRLGVGNTASMMFALERLGARAVLTDSAAEIGMAERVILPGVGAAAHAMAAMRELGLEQILRDFSRPLLGVCLGQQLLYEGSEEGDAQGLGRIAGQVRALSPAPDRPVPHMGWNQLQAVADDSLLEGVKAGGWVYFVHGYAAPVGPETLASAHYGAPFSAVVRAGQAWGCQFHPERSAAVGARILANFLRVPC